MASLAALQIADDPDVWADLGFTTTPEGAVWVDGVEHHLGSEGKRIVGWSLFGVSLPPGATSVDGLATTVVDDLPDPGPTTHPNGVTGLDHVVVATPDHARTIAALETVGLRLLRVRETDSYGTPMRQAFFRLGPVILEVVGGHEPDAGPARFFGLAWTCADLDATVEWFGGRLHPPKAAVQEGRRIATLDRGAGTTVAMAFMSPDPPR